jgi:steroid delta-isomerase-like uncharacterized protein
MPTETQPLVARLIEAYASPTLDEFDALLTEDVVLVRDGEKAHGPAEFKAILARLRRAFPDLEYRIDDVIAAGDKLVLRWAANGTHQGEYLGVPASGRAVSYTGITVYELRGERVARAWVSADLLSLLRRLREGRPDARPEARA